MEQNIIKKTGATFTPPALADFLAEKIISEISFDNRDPSLKIVDPACGDGELLLSIGNKLKRLSKLQFELVGYDQSEQYVRDAQSKLSSANLSQSDITKEDFLAISSGIARQASFPFNGNKNSCFLDETADVIIANPPYVRTQTMGAERAQELSDKFGLSGRIDLYHPFLISMTNCLKPGGVIGVLTSNKFLFNKSGEAVRRFLTDNYDIVEVIDLGDTKLFDAAVLPSIFIGKKKHRDSNGTDRDIRFRKIYELANGNNSNCIEVDSIFDILNCSQIGQYQTKGKKYSYSTGILLPSSDKKDIWKMLTKGELEWVKTVESNADCTVKDVAKVKVGVKTTADNVFIRDNWEELESDLTPEPTILRKLISQKNIDKWRTTANEYLKILYTHTSVDGKKHTIDLKAYPKAKKYLDSHKEQLAGRSYVIKANRKWFEIWVPQNPSDWFLPKLIFPDISPSPRFYYETDGSIVNGNCYWIIPKDHFNEDALFVIQGIANTKLMTRYHDLCFGNKLYSGRRRYFSQYVERYPLPNLSSSIAKKIVVVVKKLNDRSITDAEIEDLESKLEELVAKAFNVEVVTD